MQSENLREIVDQMSAMAKTKRLDVSFNELFDMYKSKELEISPSFQRVFVWNDERQSQFIESLLLELPIPPIYVVEHGEEGHYLLIDGLQRLSSYFHFRGVLDNEHKKIKVGDFLRLKGCDIVDKLNQKTWDAFDTALQIRLKRAFVSLQVIRKESLADLKFHMFKRLNSGGVEISPHQIRNAYIRMLDQGDRFMDFIANLAADINFKETCTEMLTDLSKDDQQDQNLLLRFFAYKNMRDKYVHDIEPFVDEFAEKIARTVDGEGDLRFDYDNEEILFKRTFEVLNKSSAEMSFTFGNKKTKKLTGGFSAYHYEAVTLGVQKNLSKLNPSDPIQMEKLKNKLIEIRMSDKFVEVSSGGGKNTKNHLAKRIKIIEDGIDEI